MPSLEKIIEDYALTVHGTGGNCEAYFHELNTHGDHILIADEYSLLTEKYAQNITIAVYLHDKTELFFEVENLDQLDSRLSAIYELWGY